MSTSVTPTPCKGGFLYLCKKKQTRNNFLVIFQPWRWIIVSSFPGHLLQNALYCLSSSAWGVKQLLERCIPAGKQQRLSHFHQHCYSALNCKISFLSLFPHFIFLSSVYDLISTPTPFLYFPNTKGESGGWMIDSGDLQGFGSVVHLGASIMGLLRTTALRVKAKEQEKVEAQSEKVKETRYRSGWWSGVWTYSISPFFFFFLFWQRR